MRFERTEKVRSKRILILQIAVAARLHFFKNDTNIIKWLLPRRVQAPTHCSASRFPAACGLPGKELPAMRVMLIDDERPALDEMAYLIGQYGGDTEIIGQYQNPAEALKAMLQKPDVVFVDIDIPSMSGIDLAENLKRIHPHASVVFVTSHSEYALAGYSVYPLDYILKPVEPERLCQTLDRARNLLKKGETERQAGYMVRCFGHFELSRIDDTGLKNPLHFNSKKEKELLAYLIFRFDKPVFRTELLELLFKGTENAQTINHLHVMIHHIRKQLKTLHASCTILYTDGKYTLHMPSHLCDYIDFMQCIQKLYTIGESNEAQALRLIRIFQCDYLEEDDFPWMQETQQYLETIYIRLVLRLAEYYRQYGQGGKERDCLFRLVERFPLSEDGWRSLLALHVENENKLAFIRTYEKYRKLLKTEFSIRPEDHFTQLYRQYKKELELS